MNKSLCAHCKNCEEVKYDGFLCDCTGYLEDKTTSTGCVMFEDDGFVNPETTNKEENEMTNKNHQYSMSDVIATMAINGATKDELDRIIKYSAAVIDAERARKELDIDELEKKYMSRYPLPTMVELTCTDPATGEDMVYTGRPLEPGMQFVSDRMNEIGKEITNKHKEDKENV